MKEQNLEAVYINCLRVNLQYFIQYVLLTGGTALVRAVARGGPVVTVPTFEVCAPLFKFIPLVAAYIQYSIFKMRPPFWSLVTPASKSCRRAWPLSQKN